MQRLTTVDQKWQSIYLQSLLTLFSGREVTQKKGSWRWKVGGREMIRWFTIVCLEGKETCKIFPCSLNWCSIYPEEWKVEGCILPRGIEGERKGRWWEIHQPCLPMNGVLLGHRPCILGTEDMFTIQLTSTKISLCAIINHLITSPPVSVHSPFFSIFWCMTIPCRTSLPILVSAWNLQQLDQSSRFQQLHQASINSSCFKLSTTPSRFCPASRFQQLFQAPTTPSNFIEDKLVNWRSLILIREKHNCELYWHHIGWGLQLTGASVIFCPRAHNTLLEDIAHQLCRVMRLTRLGLERSKLTTKGTKT